MASGKYRDFGNLPHSQHISGFDVRINFGQPACLFVCLPVSVISRMQPNTFASYRALLMHTQINADIPHGFPPIGEHYTEFFVHAHFRIILLLYVDIRVDDDCNENVDEQKEAHYNPRPDEH